MVQWYEILVRYYLVRYVVRSYLVRSVVRDFGTKFWYDIIWFGTWYDIFGTKLSGSVRVRTFGSWFSDRYEMVRYGSYFSKDCFFRTEPFTNRLIWYEIGSVRSFGKSIFIFSYQLRTGQITYQISWFVIGSVQKISFLKNTVRSEYLEKYFQKFRNFRNF